MIKVILLFILLRSDFLRPKVTMTKTLKTKLSIQVTKSRKKPSSILYLTNTGNMNEMNETMKTRAMTSVRNNLIGKFRTPLATCKRTNTSRKYMMMYIIYVVAGGRPILNAIHVKGNTRQPTIVTHN